MQFKEIDGNKKTDWNKFILENSPESFLQSFEWGEFQKAFGRSVFRFAIFEEDKILMLASVIEHKLPLGLRYWYIPRGPVAVRSAGERKENDSLDFLMKSLRDEASRRKIIFIRMDPAYEKNKAGIFMISGIKFVSGSVQPKDTLVLDLAKSEEQLLSEMKQKTRYNIRLAEKKGVFVFHNERNKENLEEFWRIIKQTSERDGIVPHNKEYYRKMLEVLDAESGNLKCRLYFAKVDGTVLAANIVLFFGDYSVYLHGASSNNFRNLMAPYLLQWRQILDAKNAGCRIYDFWGITVDNENPKWEGITRFKEGFGGEEVSYAGVLDLPVNSALYKIYSAFKKL